jgi:hypothetical protein
MIDLALPTVNGNPVASMYPTIGGRAVRSVANGPGPLSLDDTP